MKPRMRAAVFEGVGKLVVKEVETPRIVKPVQRVVVNPNNYCGVCRYCRLNLPNECEHIIPWPAPSTG